MPLQWDDLLFKLFEETMVLLFEDVYAEDTPPALASGEMYHSGLS